MRSSPAGLHALRGDLVTTFERRAPARRFFCASLASRRCSLAPGLGCSIAPCDLIPDSRSMGHLTEAHGGEGREGSDALAIIELAVERAALVELIVGAVADDAPGVKDENALRMAYRAEAVSHNERRAAL